MNDLLEFAIKAHGGLDRWNNFESISAHLNSGGLLWILKGKSDLLKDIDFTVDLHRQHTSHYPFGNPDYRTSFEPAHVAIERLDGSVVEELYDPWSSFKGHTRETLWTDLQVAYATGFALWTYLSTPFSLKMPGFETKEIDPWEENGETWRRLKAIFPDHIVSYSKEQVFYFDKDGLMKRHDYNVEVSGSAPTAHYISGHQEFQGIMVPTTRRVYVRQSDNTPRLPEPLIMSIDLSNIQFS